MEQYTNKRSGKMGAAMLALLDKRFWKGEEGCFGRLVRNLDLSMYSPPAEELSVKRKSVTRLRMSALREVSKTDDAGGASDSCSLFPD